MNRGLYTAYTGMLAQQLKLDTISNNIANANTTGFKKENVVIESFNEVYMKKINDPENMMSVQRIGKSTSGSHVANIYTNFEQGGLQETESPFNIALEGTGAIAVGKPDADGNMAIKYTRDGNLTSDQENRLVTTDGYYVLGTEGEPITLGNSAPRITETGSVYDGNTYLDQIRIVDFEDLSTLKKIGDELYETTDASVEKAFEGKVVQGFLEGSNVNSVSEMVNMINVMRSYEAGQKIITTYDSTLSKAVNEVGRV